MIWFFVQAGSVVARAMSLLGSMSVIVAMLPIFSMIVVGCSVLSGECLMDVSSIVLGWRAVVVVEVISLSQSGRLIITDDAAANRNCFKFSCSIHDQVLHCHTLADDGVLAVQVQQNVGNEKLSTDSATCICELVGNSAASRVLEWVYALFLVSFFKRSEFITDLVASCRLCLQFAELIDPNLVSKACSEAYRGDLGTDGFAWTLGKLDQERLSGVRWIICERACGKLSFVCCLGLVRLVRRRVLLER